MKHGPERCYTIAIEIQCSISTLLSILSRDCTAQYLDFLVTKYTMSCTAIDCPQPTILFVCLLLLILFCLS